MSSAETLKVKIKKKYKHYVFYLDNCSYYKSKCCCSQYLFMSFIFSLAIVPPLNLLNETCSLRSAMAVRGSGYGPSLSNRTLTNFG